MRFMSIGRSEATDSLGLPFFLSLRTIGLSLASRASIFANYGDPLDEIWRR